MCSCAWKNWHLVPCHQLKMRKGNVQLLKVCKESGEESSVFEHLHMGGIHACFEDDLVLGIPEGIREE